MQSLPTIADNAQSTQQAETWFISRHEGAILWAKNQNLPITKWCSHLEIEQIHTGDIVMGTLPVHMAAEICQRGATFYFLQVNMPEHLRGQELSNAQLLELGCKLTQFKVIQGPDFNNRSQ